MEDETLDLLTSVINQAACSVREDSRKCMDELAEYRKLGTVSELKALVEEKMQPT